MKNDICSQLFMNNPKTMYIPGDFSHFGQVTRKIYSNAYKVVEKNDWWKYFDLKTEGGALKWDNTAIDFPWPGLERVYVLGRIHKSYPTFDDLDDWFVTEPTFNDNTFRRTIIALTAIRELGWEGFVNALSNDSAYFTKYDHFSIDLSLFS